MHVACFFFNIKVIFKSAKLIPCMIIDSYYDSGSVTKKYGTLDYLAALLLCAGAVGYTFSESYSPQDHQLKHGKEEMNDIMGEEVTKEGEVYQATNTPVLSPRNFGIFLLFISVCCDAFLPNLQLQFMKGDRGRVGNKQGNITPFSDKNKSDEASYNNDNNDGYSDDDGKPMTSRNGADSAASLMVNTNGKILTSCTQTLFLL
jgi:hypothetical protein